MVVAVSAKDSRDAYESLSLAEATLADIGAGEADHEFVGNRRICFEEPRNPVQLGIARQGHIVKHVDEPVVRSPSCFNFEFLNRNLERVEAGLASEIGIGLRRQFMEWFFY